ncbi:LysR family transcriptional regulator [Lactiplantibacillus modestisalitolerans]|uniref:LysR family transcriptional regulator n=1 Tax=Lactiplantibacillus modestisalitolerans TaxID=1457219 RepID=A0ABV5WRY2_9LACO|nr:LysR family transcriptional regulator [Lactiplantibacillus modestisalitolerans]
MDVRVLRYFIAISQEQNISHAAARLHVSQPALSRQIADLETQLGTQLFVRGNRRLKLTEDGYYLLDRATEIIHLVDKTTRDLQQQETFSGVLDIGAGESRAVQPIMTAIQQIRRQYPAVHVNLQSGDALSLLAQLDQGNLEFALMLEAKPYPNYHHLKLPTTNQWGLLMRRDEPLATASAITPADLLGRPLLTSRQAANNQRFQQWSNGLTSQYNYVGSYNLIFNAGLLVETGACMALTYDGLIDTTAHSQLVFRPLTPALRDPVTLIWSKERPLPRVGQLFIETLRTLIEPAAK